MAEKVTFHQRVRYLDVPLGTQNRNVILLLLAVGTYLPWPPVTAHYLVANRGAWYAYVKELGAKETK